MSFFTNPVKINEAVISLSLGEQLKINEAVVSLGEQLEKVPENFFYGLTAEQFDLCLRVRLYVRPLIYEFKADTEEKRAIEKRIHDDGIKKEFTKMGLKTEDGAKMYAIAGLASKYKEGGCFSTQIKNDHAYHLVCSQGLYGLLHRETDSSDGTPIFHGYLEEFKKLTKLLKSKVGSPPEQSGELSFKNLPEEVRQIISGLTNVETWVALTRVEKGAVPKKFAEIAWKGLAKQIGLEELNPQVINTLRDKILQDRYAANVKVVVDFDRPTSAYASDPRFEKVFGRQRFLREVAKEKVTSDNLKLIVEWKKNADLLRVWERIAHGIRVRVTPKDLGNYQPNADFSFVWRDMSYMRMAVKGMDPWMEKNKDAIAAMTELNVGDIGPETLPDLIKEMRASNKIELI